MPCLTSNKNPKTKKSIAHLLKPLLLLSLISLSFSGLVIPGKKIAVLPEDTVVEVTDPNLRRASAGVPMGRRLIIKLKGSIESGKGWYMRDFKKADRELIVPQNLNSFNCGEYVNNQDECGRITNDGFYYFIYKPRRVGKVTLNFAYRKPFQWDSPKNARFQVNIRVMRNAFDDTVGLQEDSDAKKFYQNYQRKQKTFKAPKKIKDHTYRGFNHKFKKYSHECDHDWDF